MSPSRAYQPYVPAKRPAGKPAEKPKYRVLVHRQYKAHYEQLVKRVGPESAQQFWDHVSQTPGEPCPVASTTVLKGKAGRPIGPGWSRTIHYEVSGAGRIDYQYCDQYRTTPDGDIHQVVCIRTINYASH